MIVLDTNVISELRKKPHIQDPKVCAWSQTYPARAFYLTTLTIMEIERGKLMEEAKNSPQGPVLRTWFTRFALPTQAMCCPSTKGPPFVLLDSQASTVRR
jgi:predicted nucleic acid-binding protein